MCADHGDLVQETMISALEGLERYKGGSSIQTWLVGILKHKIYDYFRKNSREVSTAELSKLTRDPASVLNVMCRSIRTWLIRFIRLPIALAAICPGLPKVPSPGISTATFS